MLDVCVALLHLKTITLHGSFLLETGEGTEIEGNVLATVRESRTVVPSGIHRQSNRENNDDYSYKKNQCSTNYHRFDNIEPNCTNTKAEWRRFTESSRRWTAKAFEL